MEIRPPQSVAEIESLVSNDFVSKVQMLGQTRDKASLGIARLALDMIQEWGDVSRKAVYGFYAKHTATSSETIRKDVKMLELIPAEYWQRYEVIGISFFRHITHFEAERMTQALDYALERRCIFDEFKLMYPRLKSEEEKEKENQVVDTVKRHQYPFEFLPVIRNFRELGKFEVAKPHLDALKALIEESNV